jgi:hypothetical protein
MATRNDKFDGNMIYTLLGCHFESQATHFKHQRTVEAGYNRKTLFARGERGAGGGGGGGGGGVGGVDGVGGEGGGGGGGGGGGEEGG